MHTQCISKQFHISQALYTASYATIVICTYVMDLSGYGSAPHAETIRLLMLAFASACMMVKVCLDRYNARYLLVFLLAMFVLAVSLWRTRYDHMLYLLIAICGAKGISYRKLVRVDLVVRVLCVSSIIVGAWIGWLDDYMVIRPQTQTLRHSLGFIHPNSLGVCTAMTLLSWAHSRKGALGASQVAALAMGCFLLVAVCESRSSAACLLLYAALRIAGDRRKRKAEAKTGFFYALFRNLHFLSLAVCVAWMLLSNSIPWLMQADAWTSYRFQNAKEVWDHYGLSLLGQRVILVSTRVARELGTRFLLLDVAPLRMLIQGGLAATVLIEVLWMAGLSRSLRENDAKMCALLATFVFFGMCESTANNPGICFVLPYMGAVLYEGREAHALPDAARQQAITA